MAAPRSAASASSTNRGGALTINGKTNPELLFPFELYDVLLWGVGADDKANATVRRFVDPQLATFGYATAFWSKLGSVARPYLASKQRDNTSAHASTSITDERGNRVHVTVAHDVCAGRLASLEAARGVFGGEQFDRFLYTVVAPHVQHSTSAVSNNDAVLRYITRGCK